MLQQVNYIKLKIGLYDSFLNITKSSKNKRNVCLSVVLKLLPFFRLVSLHGK